MFAAKLLNLEELIQVCFHVLLNNVPKGVLK